MKKFKIMLASMAFLFAIAAVFASKNVSDKDTLDQYYEKNGIECEPTNCSPENEGETCGFIVYEEDLVNECSSPVTVPTYRPL